MIAVTAAELRYGVARLPDSHRRRELAVVIRGILTEDFHGRVLPFDERASVRYWPPVTPPTSRKRESNSSILGSFNPGSPATNG